MTALNVWIKPKAGYVVTDTAQYGADDGTVLGFTAKAFAIPRLRMIVAASGLVTVMRLAEELDRHPSRTQADLKAALPKAVRALWEQNARTYPDTPPNLWAVSLRAVYWNRLAKRAEVSLCDTLGEHLEDGREPFRLYTGSSSLLHPDIPDGEGFSRLDPETEAVGLLQRQRDGTTKIARNGEPHAIVGGQVHLLKVTAAGISQAVLHQWPDIIGERIRAGAPSPESEASHG